MIATRNRRLGPVAAASARLEESFTLRRLQRRLGRGTPPPRACPPERPVGVKLELTHACNLRCDFCYTDSPRHTVARTVDLDDDAWRGVVEEAIELGVIEAVLTGGEPLLRAPLALELIERMARAGIAVTLNTNGWFVDEPLADRLAAVPGLTVSVSVDGATPELHDAARGVPGSWRRAVSAIALLLERDVRVTVGHVVTPLNARWFAQLLEHAWLLGVRSIRVTPVVPVGAASRERGWTVDRRALRRAGEAARARFGEDFDLLIQSGVAEIVAHRDVRAPAALLVRPSGAVLIDSLHPFAFGRVQDGLQRCWERIVDSWSHPDIVRWAGAIRSSRGLARASLIPYADDEAAVGAQAPQVRRRAITSPRLPRRSASSTQPAAGPGDLAAARSFVLQRALARRYAPARMRWSGDRDGERVVRLLDSGRVCRLNGTAGLLLDELAEGASVREVVEALSARHPAVPRPQLERDAVASVRELAARGILRAPAGLAA